MRELELELFGLDPPAQRLRGLIGGLSPMVLAAVAVPWRQPAGERYWHERRAIKRPVTLWHCSRWARWFSFVRMRGVSDFVGDAPRDLSSAAIIGADGDRNIA